MMDMNNEFVVEMDKTHFEKMCRCCLVQITEMKSLYEDDIHSMMMACTAINISLDDGLPSLICCECYYLLKQAYSFRQICERSDATLRQCFVSQPISDANDLNMTLNTEILSEKDDNLNSYKLVLVKYVTDDNSTLAISSANQTDNEITLMPEDGTNCTATASLDAELTLKNTIHLSDLSEDVQFLNEEFIGIFQMETMKDGETNEYINISTDNVLPNDDLISANPSPTPPEDVIACPVCNKIFGDKHKLNRHKKMHMPERPFDCHNCDKSFVERGCLKKHMKRHQSERPFLCNVCGMKFFDKSSLEIHIRIHTGYKPFVCQFENCGKAFTQSSQLEMHKKTHSAEKENACDVCGKRFTLPYQLKIHKRTHTNEKPYECEHCGKKFSQSGNLTTHIRTHTGDKPFSCSFNLCDRSFASVGELNSHLRKHTGQKLEKKLVCAQCGKMCRSRFELTNHMNTHAGVKPYVCTVCNKSFLMSSHLVVHMRNHTGERPYACEFCTEKAFTTTQMLKAHMRIHTGEKKYACDLCDKKFSQAAGRNAHRKIHLKGWANVKEKKHETC